MVSGVAIAMIKINTAKFDRAINAAFKETAADLNDSFHRSIVDPKWQWNKVTVRRNGETVSSPRNIVDEGTLRDSQEFVMISFQEAQYNWNVPYANYVRFGYTTRSGTVVAGRDWIEDGIKSIDLGKIFAARLRSKLN